MLCPPKDTFYHAGSPLTIIHLSYAVLLLINITSHDLTSSHWAHFFLDFFFLLLPHPTIPDTVNWTYVQLVVSFHSEVTMLTPFLSYVLRVDAEIQNV